MILLRYEKGKTYRKIADIYERSKSRIEQIIKKALRKLHHSSRVAYIVNGYEMQKSKRDRQRELLKIQCLTWRQ
jgi:DNA-binding NarL/FixJ family response regulator